MRLSVHTIASRRVGIAVALFTVLALMGATPAQASDVRVRHTLFGAHDRTPGAPSYARIHEGAVRLWDVGVRWSEVETKPGEYVWTRLDQLVTDAQQAHAEVTMVVAMTPSFYASSPTKPPRSIGPYKRFVRALMNRYRHFHGRRGISAYQVWNEVNITTFWTGSLSNLVRLTHAMDHVRDRHDPQAKVIAPAMVTRMAYQQEGISAYYRRRFHGTPVWRYVDAVSLSLYPMSRYGSRAGVPEDSMALLGQVRRILHGAGVPASMPIWNTEVNYGLNSGARGGTPADPISASRQAANVARTYLLNAANGVKRAFWYRYDMSRHPGGTIGNTLLADPDDPFRVSPAGRAYVRVQQWMHGTLQGTPRHRPCRHDRHDTYTCVVRDHGQKRYIYWNPFHGARVTLARGVHHRQDVLGKTGTVKPRATITVGYKPVMVS